MADKALVYPSKKSTVPKDEPVLLFKSMPSHMLGEFTEIPSKYQELLMKFMTDDEKEALNQPNGFVPVFARIAGSTPGDHIINRLVEKDPISIDGEYTITLIKRNNDLCFSGGWDTVIDDVVEPTGDYRTVQGWGYRSHAGDFRMIIKIRRSYS